MVKFQSASMQSKPAKRVSFCTVIFVPGKRVSFAGKVCSYLIFSPGIKTKLKKRMEFSRCNDSVMSSGSNSFEFRLAVFYQKIFCVNRFFRPVSVSVLNGFFRIFLVRQISSFWHKTDVVCVVRNFIINDAAGRQKNATLRIFRNSMIKPLRYHFVPAVHDFFLGRLRHCEHHYAAGISVQTVNNKRPVIAGICSFFAHNLFKDFNGSSCVASRIRHRQHSAWLKNDAEGIIFVKYVNLFFSKINFIFFFKFCTSFRHFLIVLVFFVHNKIAFHLVKKIKNHLIFLFSFYAGSFRSSVNYKNFRIGLKHFVNKRIIII